MAASGGVSSDRLTKRMVFVVDDDVTFRRDVCEALEEAGYISVGAANGRDAIESLTFGTIRPDLFLIDLRMPEVDGFELKAWLENQPKFKKIPMMVLTGNPEPSVLTRLRPTPILTKPVGFDELMDRVAQLLGLKKAS